MLKAKRPADGDKTDTPWVVRDVPEHTRKQVKLYAVEHDMTMGKAVEVIVESIHRRHARRLFDALLHLYRCVRADDMDGARRAAETVSEYLARGEQDIGWRES